MAKEKNTLDIKKELRKFIEGKFSIKDIESVDDDDSFLEKGIIDSTGVLELVSYIEKQYGIKVQDEELTPENLDSFNKVTTYIQRRKGYVA